MSEEFIIGNYISSDRNDVHTLIPFMTYLKRYPIKRVSVDAGYGSEENYCYFEENNDTELYLYLRKRKADQFDCVKKSKVPKRL